MLPLVIAESKIFIFKFWFEGETKEGMCYKNELFCRLQKFNIHDRVQVYHLGSRLANQEVLIAFTASAEDCSLWVSLRDPLAKELLLKANEMDLRKIEEFTVRPS